MLYLYLLNEPYPHAVADIGSSTNIFCEPIPDNRRPQRHLRSLRHQAQACGLGKFITQSSMPTAAALVEATEKSSATAKKTPTAFNIATDTDVPLFDFFAQSPELANCFASYMKSVQARYGTRLQHILTGFD